MAPMKLISWNVNGVRAVLRKDALAPLLREHTPDVLCLQETKARGEQVELPERLAAVYPHRSWNAAKNKKGYSGTAIWSRHAPLAIEPDLGVARHDEEGRVLAAEFDNHYVVSVYVPNAKRDLSRLPDRRDWDRTLLAYLQRLETHKPVIWAGDLTVAHTEIDLARPRQNRGQHGFTEEERAGFAAFLAAGFVDSFRALHPDRAEAYTWWRQFGGARERNVGWRIDYVLISNELRPQLRDAFILDQFYGSDHCPVGVTLAS